MQKQFHFGKHAPKHDYRTLLFRNYSGSLPASLGSFNALDNVFKNLPNQTVEALFPMDGNDYYGDCTIAGLAHAISIFKALIDKEHIMSEKSAINLYFKLTGGVDSGLNMLDVLNYWRKNKIGGNTIIGYTSIDPKNHEHIKQAIELFNGVYLGFQVQKNCLQEFDAGKPWTPGKLTNSGHAVFAYGYDANGVDVLTWGSKTTGTWDWWDECVDEAYAILPTESKKEGFSNFDFAQLKEDLGELTQEN